MNYINTDINKYQIEYGQDRYVVLPTHTYVGYYQIGSHFQIMSEKKPKWFHRKMMNICLGIKWFDELKI